MSCKASPQLTCTQSLQALGDADAPSTDAPPTGTTSAGAPPTGTASADGPPIGALSTTDGCSACPEHLPDSRRRLSEAPGGPGHTDERLSSVEALFDGGSLQQRLPSTTVYSFVRIGVIRQPPALSHLKTESLKAECLQKQSLGRGLRFRRRLRRARTLILNYPDSELESSFPIRMPLERDLIE